MLSRRWRREGPLEEPARRGARALGTPHLGRGFFEVVGRTGSVEGEEGRLFGGNGVVVGSGGGGGGCLVVIRWVSGGVGIGF